MIATNSPSKVIKTRMREIAEEIRLLADFGLGEDESSAVTKEVVALNDYLRGALPFTLNDTLHLSSADYVQRGIKIKASELYPIARTLELISEMLEFGKRGSINDLIIRDSEAEFILRTTSATLLSQIMGVLAALGLLTGIRAYS